MHKIIYLSLLSILLIPFSVPAQSLVWDKKADEVLQQSKRLIVLLVDATDLPNDKKFKNNPELIKAYGKYVAAFNQLIKEPIQARWRLTKQIDFMTVQELRAFKKKAADREQEEILVMMFNSLSYQFMAATANLSKEEVAGFTVEKGNPDYKSQQSIWLMTLKNVGFMGKEDAPFTSFTNGRANYNCNRWCLTIADLSFAIENMQEMLVLYAKGGRDIAYNAFDPANKGQLAQKTLLIPVDYTIKAKDGKPSITEEEIKKSYPWPWRFASLAEIDEAVARKDTGVAVLLGTDLIYATSTYEGCYFWAVAAADIHTILGYSAAGNKQVGVSTAMKEQNLFDLNVRRVEEIVKNAQRD